MRPKTIVLTFGLLMAMFAPVPHPFSAYSKKRSNLSLFGNQWVNCAKAP